jgi:sugar O-acyltransferase (sialic acid O-acetyltransferase NeuD family)
MNDYPVVLLGAGGHASVLIDILRENKQTIAGVITPVSPTSIIFSDIKQYNSDDDLGIFSVNRYAVVVAIGAQPDDRKRINIINMLLEKGYSFKSVLSQRAIISQNASLGLGVQILPGAIINAGASIGQHVVVNSRAVIEHDCIVDDFCHIAPGAVLCGGVCIAKHVFIGAGAVVLPGVNIGSNSIIGANALVDKDIPDNTTLYGCRGKLK